MVLVLNREPDANKGIKNTIPAVRLGAIALIEEYCTEADRLDPAAFAA